MTPSFRFESPRQGLLVKRLSLLTLTQQFWVRIPGDPRSTSETGHWKGAAVARVFIFAAFLTVVLGAGFFGILLFRAATFKRRNRG